MRKMFEMFIELFWHTFYNEIKRRIRVLRSTRNFRRYNVKKAGRKELFCAPCTKCERIGLARLQVFRKIKNCSCKLQLAMIISKCDISQ